VEGGILWINRAIIGVGKTLKRISKPRLARFYVCMIVRNINHGFKKIVLVFYIMGNRLNAVVTGSKPKQRR
jgi:hypothetical protein